MGSVLVRWESWASLLLELRFNDVTLSTATGFLVTYGVDNKVALITNRHNVTGRRQSDGKPISKNGGIPDRVTIWQNSLNRLGTWFPETHMLLDGEGNPLWKEHPTLKSRADFVALPITPNVLTRIAPYSLKPPEIQILLSPAEPVSVVGFPFGLTASGRFAIWATGFLATDIGIDYEGLPMFLIDCRSRQGQSGSPVIASRNGAVPTLGGGVSLFTEPVSAFLGIYSGRVNTESDLGMVWKRSAVDELVDSLI